MKNNILKSLERIELQQKAIWWDMIMIWFWAYSWSLLLVGILFKKILFLVLGGLSFFLIIPIQICERREMDKVKKYYEKTRKEI